jgi:hypothetical protein
MDWKKFKTVGERYAEFRKAIEPEIAPQRIATAHSETISDEERLARAKQSTAEWRLKSRLKQRYGK